MHFIGRLRQLGPRRLRKNPAAGPEEDDARAPFLAGDESVVILRKSCHKAPVTSESEPQVVPSLRCGVRIAKSPLRGPSITAGDDWCIPAVTIR